jgi:hypothetical protein
MLFVEQGYVIASIPAEIVRNSKYYKRNNKYYNNVMW